MKPESIKPEFGEIKGDGMCAHGNFKDNCAPCQEESKRTDERLSLEEAQKEAPYVQRDARISKSLRERKVGTAKILKDTPYGPERLRLFKENDEKVARISSGDSEQPDRDDYEKASETRDVFTKTIGGEYSVKPISYERSELSDVKNRALEYVEQGDLKGSIDSVVSDMNKDKSRPEMQKSMIVMMGMGLRNESNLTKEKVIEFIKGFN